VAVLINSHAVWQTDGRENVNNTYYANLCLNIELSAAGFYSQLFVFIGVHEGAALSSFDYFPLRKKKAKPS
jgi:hypothetical protein